MLRVEFFLKMTMLVTSICLSIYYHDLANIPIMEITVTLVILAQFVWRRHHTDEGDNQGPNASGSKRVRFPWLSGFIVLQIILSCLWLPRTLFFIPLFYFELYMKKPSYLLYFLPILLAGVVLNYPILLTVAITGIALLASYLHTSIQRAADFQANAYQQIDQLSAVNQRFRQEQQHLIAVQDQRSESQVLSERKRIVDEIHDILGHQLSSAVIQIGALEYVVTDEVVKASLGQVRQVLNTSMANIRTVIHEERASTIHLERELTAVTNAFTKAPVQFTYQNQRKISNQMAHSIMNIVREGLANINKHSNATKVNIRFVETTDKWLLLIADNGDRQTSNQSQTGIGLLNIEERIQLLGGTLHISRNNGFRIFITIPFKELADEHPISR